MRTKAARPARPGPGHPALRPVALATALFCVCLPLHARINAEADFTNLSFDELANIEVTSVSKKSERLAEAPASVFVITSEDIRSAGARSLPEALRLAPNLQVARAYNSGYTISARGFNNSAANKLLVLIDGRSVYTPLYAGVFWDVQDVLMDDLERIEVISGPGGTLWGTNAVNGVINIITKRASQTQGGMATFKTARGETTAAARYGAKTEGGISYRVYAKNAERSRTELESGKPVNDAMHQVRAGFSMEWEGGDDRFTFQGETYRGGAEQPEPGLISVTGINNVLGSLTLRGGNLLARWERQLAGGAAISVQAYYDRTDRTVPPTFAEKLDIVDLQLQHALAPMGVHALNWGAQLRQSRDRLTNSSTVAFLPARENQNWTSLYASDDIALRENLKLVLGARMERNDYTGNEFLPSARLAWQVSPDHMLWTSASRTVRAPSRFDVDVFVPGKAPFILTGGAAVVSEVAKVIELGYRGKPAANLTYSATLFHADYDHLRTQEVAPSRTSIFFASQMEGTTNGIEMWATWQASRDWRLMAGWSALRERLALKPGSNDAAALTTAGHDPAYTLLLRAGRDISENQEVDMSLRHVAALSSPRVPAYTVLGIRYAWRVQPRLEIAVGAENLVGSGHGEFFDAAYRSWIRRSATFSVIAHF